ncbi:MAG TPA: L,D-transpeptidase family protein [Steroidobacteraceae bacterium]|nr:L,D-transpeptidase family protein [Steroidobacteraceae bacterium]
MKSAHSLARVTATALAGALLASCSLLNGPWTAPKKPEPPPAPVEPELPLGVPTHKFEITPDQDIVGVIQVTRSTKEDTLSDIARRFNVGYEEIVRANPGVDPWLPGEREIVIPSQFILPNAPREGIVINVPQMRLFYYPKPKKGEPQLVYTFPIGIGRVGWATPQGTTKIVRRQKDPTWRPTASIIKEHREERGEELERVIGPGPDNPLGRYAFYLGWPTYMIHGTNKPAGVGLRSSHGCIRLYPEDIEILFNLAPIGTKVTVINEPFVFGWQNDQLYLQAFDVLEDDTRDWKKAQKKLVSKALGADIQKQLKKRHEEMNWDLVAAAARQPRGIPVSISGAGDDVSQLIASAPRVQNVVPPGASWDGKTDLPVDEETFRSMLSDRDPQAPTTVGGSGTATAAPANGTHAAPAPAKTGT